MELTPGTAVAVYYLVAIGLASVLFVYLATRRWATRRTRVMSGPRPGRGAAGPLAIAGLGAGLLAFWTWMPQPLPSDFNLLFQDVYFFFAVVLLALAVALVIAPSSAAPVARGGERDRVPG